MPERADRYHRQTILPGFGPEGRDRLGRAHAAVVGCGALGCSAADLLVRAGVGRVTLIDRDVVEWTNLQRQTLFDEADAREGVPKAEAARRRLAAVNSEVGLVAHVADVTAENVAGLLGVGDGSGGLGVLLDGTDNFETRYLLNDVAVRFGVPLVYGGVVGTRGMQMTVRPGSGACLRCVFEDPPAAGSSPTCDTAGVLGAVVAIVAAVQAAEAMKVLLGREDLASATLLDMDPWRNERRRIEVARRADCPCCGERRFAFLEAPSGDAASLCGQDAVQVRPMAGVGGVDLAALAARLAAHGAFARVGASMLRGTLAGERGDAGGPVRLSVFADGRAIVGGTTRPERARSIYARYVGG